jgi:hypothetical protein
VIGEISAGFGWGTAVIGGGRSVWSKFDGITAPQNATVGIGHPNLGHRFMSAAAAFPIDLSAYKKVTLDPSHMKLSAQQKADLQFNIQLCRDAIVFFTATGAARGVGGHTGGPYDTVPEVMILDALFKSHADKFVPIFFDEERSI